MQRNEPTRANRPARPLPVEVAQLDPRSPSCGSTFLRRYVGPRVPVLLQGLVGRWPALERWTPAYFRSIGAGVRVKVKLGDVAEGVQQPVSLSDYAGRLERYEDGQESSRPPYLHDVPLLHWMPELLADVDPFPTELLPPWYRARWWSFVQYFMGPTGASTPLHFDTLLTHNLFFHVVGRKRFTLISPSDHDRCYLRDWRWSDVDAEAPDLARFPRLRSVRRQQVIVEPGDVLYLPPGTLHQVTSLSFTASFNIDWHTPHSAAWGMTTVLRGAPPRNLYYNALAFLGVALGVPYDVIFPLYRSYLDLVS